MREKKCDILDSDGLGQTLRGNRVKPDIGSQSFPLDI